MWQPKFKFMENHDLTITPVAYIYNDFKDSFGIPRQGGLAPGVSSKIVFTKEFRDKNALRGIEQYSHLWLLWGFSDNFGKAFSPTVRPPKLGGNKRVGVFATRSPFRPNFLGLSCVEFAGIGENDTDGIYLTVSGADMKNGTPIYDIKPYLPYVDIKEGAKGGFSDDHKDDRLEVELSPEAEGVLGEALADELVEVLSLDPTPQYKGDSEKIYALSLGGYEIKFLREDGKIIVISATEEKEEF